MPTRYHHVYLPPTDRAQAPLLLLHGTGGNEEDLIPLARRLAPGAALLSPRGDVLEGGAARFFRRFAEGVFDLDDVRHRTAGLAEFIAAAAAHYGFDPQRLIALGYSNGANIAATLLLQRPQVLAGAVLLRAMVVLDAPAPSGSLLGKRVLLANGEQDPTIPSDHPDRLAALLRAGGAEVQLHRTSGAGHGLAASDLAAAEAYFRAGGTP